MFPAQLKKKKRGFTLIELMVVIAIIAILSVVGVVAYRGVTGGARDVKRRADIESLAKAYEANYNGTYQALDAAGGNFASGIPKDPDSSKGDYFNWLAADKSGFKVCASLEANSNKVCNTSAQNCYCQNSSQGTISSFTAYDPSSSPASTIGSIGFGGTTSAPSCDPNGSLFNGLVGWWKMSNNTNDSSGYNNNGNATNVNYNTGDYPGLTNGPFKPSAVFNNASPNQSLITVADNASLDFGQVTISLWVKATSGDNTDFNGLVWKNDDGDLNGYKIGFNSTSGTLRADFSNSNYTSPGGLHYITASNTKVVADTPSTWHLVVAVYDGSKAILYVDNVAGSATNSLNGMTSLGTNNNALLIGHDRADPSGRYFKGMIDDVRVYNRALSGPEIQNLWSGGLGCTTP